MNKILILSLAVNAIVLFSCMTTDKKETVIDDNSYVPNRLLPIYKRELDNGGYLLQVNDGTFVIVKTDRGISVTQAK